MSEYREMRGVETEGEEEIDLMELFHDAWQGMKKFWWLVAGLALILALLAGLLVRFTHTPQYTASATMTVKELGNTGYASAQSAQRMEMTFPYILTSGVLENVVIEDMGVREMPGEVEVVAEEGANLFTVSASAEDAQLAYDLLHSVIDNYPKVSEFVIGRTKLDILDESGVPEESDLNGAVAKAVKMGALIGILLGLIPIAVYALTRRTVKSKKELKTMLNLKDMGSLPMLSAKKRKKDRFLSSPSLMNDRVPQSYLEANSKLGIRVLREMEEKGYKTLLVTSSIAEEGKTTIASNLAITAAKNGKKVILVDCDLRNPSVAEVMNEEREFPGLGAMLRGEATLEEALAKVDVSGGELYVLYGGEPDEKDSRLLGTKAMKALIEGLKEHADLLILDTAPAGLLADSSVIAKFVEAAMYVVRYDHTKIRQIQNGVQALSMSGVDLIGYVFNGEENESSGGGRYGRYGRYGGAYYGNYGHYRDTGSRSRERSRRDSRD